MLATLVMTLIGVDRPGLVDLVATCVAEHRGNWLESRMCRLGGQFAGILRVEVAEENIPALEGALRSLQAEGLKVASQREASDLRAPAEGTLATLNFVGQDRPGLLRQITRILASHAVNVEELSSERISAPMEGNRLFQAQATISLPPSVSMVSLRRDLELIAADLMVDLALTPRPPVRV